MPSRSLVGRMLEVVFVVFQIFQVFKKHKSTVKQHMFFWGEWVGGHAGFPFCFCLEDP